MLLSVVVVTWRARELLQACLQSLAAQSYGELEIIVVDNDSRDGSSEMVRSDFPQVTLIETGKNLGFAEGCNLGIDASRGEWVCMLNNDAVADVDWAQALVETARNVDDDCGMLQSLMLYMARPAVVNSTGIVLGHSGGGRDRFDGQPRESCQEPAEIFCPTAGAAAYRRTMLDEVRIDGGYFDRTHFMYFEDLDLGWRARLAGWRAFFVPSSVVHHVWHGTSDRHGRRWMERMAGNNKVRMWLKNASRPMLLRTTPQWISITFASVYRREWRELVTAARDGLRMRRQVDALRRSKRRHLEQRWTGR